MENTVHLTNEININTGGVYVEFDPGRIQKISSLREKIFAFMKDLLGEDFLGDVTAIVHRGTVASEVSKLLVFSMPNGMGGADIRVEACKKYNS